MSRDEFRAEQLARIGKRYSPLLHVIGPSAWGLTVLAACVVLLRDVTWKELLTVPIVLVLSNMTEWRLHRDMLHKRSRLLPDLYDRHTPVHHRIYVHGDMQIRDWRELKLVLIPAWAGMVLLITRYWHPQWYDGTMTTFAFARTNEMSDFLDGKVVLSNLLYMPGQGLMPMLVAAAVGGLAWAKPPQGRGAGSLPRPCHAPLPGTWTCHWYM